MLIQSLPAIRATRQSANCQIASSVALLLSPPSPETDLHSLSPCQCASTSPPGGLSPQDVPQFITFTADDAIQLYTTEVMNHFLANRSVRRST